ncbi:MAG: alpha-hydroxy-acid oxidizing protein [Alphaproteobacteria bacterium]|nr:alpha-hydroxy-acid oxidizing protein [Alphaproteobacteria bacterium]
MTSLRARALERAVTIADLRLIARKRLPRAVFDFIDGGAMDERTLHDNEADFARWLLMPRVAVGVVARDPAVTILGRQAALPLVLSPIGLEGFFWPGGELAAARAAAKAGVPYCLSTNSFASLEQVAQAAPEAERWFQLYFLRDRDWMHGLLERAAASNYRVLCLTVDLPMNGRRERDVRHGFTIPLKPRLATMLDMTRHSAWAINALRAPPTFGNFPIAGGGGFTNIAQHVASLFDPAATWDDVARIRDKWRGPMVIKGILHPDDAAKAVVLGIEAVMVSNHGGRQLDHSPSAIAALPDIVAAIGVRAEILLDGGIRRGTDVLKALALGARACGIGRAMVWGVATAGEAGVARALAILKTEFDNAMALLGTKRMADITRDHVRARPMGVP